MAERQFTIMRHWGEKGRTLIPWAMIAPHERQAIRNHSQSLERLQERGGLGASEAVAVLTDSPCQEDVRSLWKADKEQRALVLYKYDQLLEDLVAAWEGDRG